MENDVEEYIQLLKLIVDNANCELLLGDIKENTNLIEDLNYDSISLIQLLTDIEDEFEVSLSNDDLLADKLDTPEALWEVICKQRNMVKEEGDE